MGSREVIGARVWGGLTGTFPNKNLRWHIFRVREFAAGVRYLPPPTPPEPISSFYHPTPVQIRESVRERAPRGDV